MQPRKLLYAGSLFRQSDERQVLGDRKDTNYFAKSSKSSFLKFVKDCATEKKYKA